MNYKNFLLLTICLVTSIAGLADIKEPQPLTAEKVFADLPHTVIDLLRPSTRLDMLDYYHQADSLVTVVNALGEESRLVEVSPDYLKVSVTPVSTLEIKILPCKKDTVVMTLYTVSSDTEVKFFDSSLRPLPSEKFLKSPSLKDFFNLKGSGITEKELNEKIPFEAIVYATGPDETPLTATLTSLSLLSQEDRDMLSPFLIPALTVKILNLH